MSKSTLAVLEHHLQAVPKGVEETMADYSAESVVVTPDATYRGLTEIRGFFAAFIKSAPAGLWAAYRMKRQEVVGELAYIHWEAKPWFLLGTDTFIIRKGKIVFQTFAGYAGAK